MERFRSVVDDDKWRSPPLSVLQSHSLYPVTDQYRTPMSVSASGSTVSWGGVFSVDTNKVCLNPHKVKKGLS